MHPHALAFVAAVFGAGTVCLFCALCKQTEAKKTTFTPTKLSALARHRMLVPKQEHMVMKRVLARINTKRAWKPSQRLFRGAWKSLLALAQTEEGGSWTLTFPSGFVNDTKLQRLYHCIETVFLGSFLTDSLQEAKADPVILTSSSDVPHDIEEYGLEPVDVPPSPEKESGQGPGSMASLHPVISSLPADGVQQLHYDSCYLRDCNIIVVNPLLADYTVLPVCCEGVLCTSMLEVFAHSIAHEMVHCLVAKVMPDISTSPAYTQSNNHGPIFSYLNYALFGHT